MFRSVVVAHDGSRCIEETLQWLRPLLGASHSAVELCRLPQGEGSELNSLEHLEELAATLRAEGALARVAEGEEDLFTSTSQRLVLLDDAKLALRLLRETSASLFLTPRGVQPHAPRRILLPLDGSQFAEEILPLLVPFGKAFQPDVSLLRVAPDLPGQGAMMAHRSSVPTTRRLLRSLRRARLTLEGEGLSVTKHTAAAGAVDSRILETAEAVEADMIAVSTHGHNRFARWLFGSCAETLIRKAQVPVLIRNTAKGSSGRAPAVSALEGAGAR